MTPARTYVTYHKRRSANECNGTDSVQRFLRAHKRRNASAMEAVHELGSFDELSPGMREFQLELLAERYEELLEENDE